MLAVVFFALLANILIPFISRKKPGIANRLRPVFVLPIMRIEAAAKIL